MEAVFVESLVNYLSSRINRLTGSCEEFHQRSFPGRNDCVISLFTPVQPAIILGSTQDRTLINEQACLVNGVEIVKRRSGGGIVFLAQDSTIWIDVEIPREHSLWLNDVGESSLWLGEVFKKELAELAHINLELHRGSMIKTTWSSLICFAGRGPGEVFTQDGRKVVGISQRRTRDWARFQCVISLQWKPELLLNLLNEPRPTISDIKNCGSDLSLDSATVAMKLIDAIQVALN
jgi:lipoate-protein ligase A